ncbi:MAG: AAA family ATPase [Candidatus Thermofonsia Clade 1 bacterium]|jgi:MoxR-like ATPase|uniref:AAA family ATPase n=1 Tax=Candidatus Thermofonsia Clade 1 bacterium TaxID=2364210 RepID=A0A2M8PWU6_9CHLR|nr:MAG: AAA family ATPase [Candidatus Thermofonsia Clade 1 bacterium]PJF42024.1 MAG: AAA family ATPase [Candidatus Thermofonsia Clade 1 bacterium]RMF49769.1 MAG: MoxR family ATPase [Chloroflexota bacterium]
MKAIQTVAERLIENVSRVIIGKRNEIRLTVIGLLCQGHVLLEDVPGVGKTMLAKALARSLGCTFSRIQFTPDMLPSDVTGVSVFNQQTRNFEFRAGPIFAQVVLADEINRATPKTQAALLEAMEERQVTVDGVTYQVDQPFMVIATQNPIEYEGTFPLPEAQLDRFLLRLRLGYPTPQEEMAMLDAQQLRHPLTTIGQVLSAEELLNMQKLVRNVSVSEEVKRYIIEIVTATRHHPDIYLGASPRGALALYRTAQARAAIAGRDHVIPDDVKALAEATLAHRIIVGPTARLREVTSRAIIQNLLLSLPVPGASPIRV